MGGFKKKTVDILARYCPLVPLPILQSAAEEITLLHIKEDNEHVKHVDNMLDAVGE